MNHLSCTLVGTDRRGKSGPQPLVATHDLGKGCFQARVIDQTLQPHRGRNDVDRARRSQLFEKPHALLGKRQGQSRCGPLGRPQRRQLAPCAARQPTSQLTGQLGDGR